MSRLPHIILPFVIITFFCVSVLNTQAQGDNLNQKIEIKFNKEPLYRALIRINQLTSYKFSYMGYENLFIPVEQFSDGQVVQLDEKLYSIQEVIEFSPDKEAEIPLYTGKLYLDAKTLALVSAEFHLNRENLKKVSESLIIKKKWNIHVRPREVSYFVNYRRIRNKYFLNQIRGELSFKV